MVEAFGGTDVTATLSIAGELASLDEYWASELCFKMVGGIGFEVGSPRDWLRRSGTAMAILVIAQACVASGAVEPSAHVRIISALVAAFLSNVIHSCRGTIRVAVYIIVQANLVVFSFVVVV